MIVVAYGTITDLFIVVSYFLNHDNSPGDPEKAKGIMLRMKKFIYIYI